MMRDGVRLWSAAKSDMVERAFGWKGQLDTIMRDGDVKGRLLPGRAGDTKELAILQSHGD